MALELRPLPERLEGRTYTFKGGVHPPEKKEISKNAATERAPIPDRVTLPVVMHVGAPAKPLVSKKDHVERGQMVAEAGGFVSAPVHSPVTGTVVDVTPMPHQSGRMVTAIVVQVDKEATAAAMEEDDTLDVSPDLDLSQFEPGQIVESVKSAGIVGLGGAAFPTFIKLTPNEKKPTEIVLVNGSECEPYLTADYRLMVEHPEWIVAGTRLAMRATGAPRAVIAVEDNKQDAIEKLRQVIRGAGIKDRIEVVAMKTRYPQGGERTLIPALLGREVPMTGFPPDVGVAILNVGTASAVAFAVVHGKPLIERIVTVTGNGVRHPGNFLTLIGTSIGFLLESRGGLTEDAARVILGGPMMGPAAGRLDLPVMKGMSGITVLRRPEAKPKPWLHCIRCGRCVDACPLSLMPIVIANLSRYGRFEEAVRMNLNACVECGTCAYVCPSGVPLVHLIRVGKAAARKLQKKQ